MSNYHITQEQALQIAKDTDSWNTISQSSFKLMPEDLANLINTALDKVLGEPIYATETATGFRELDANEYDPKTDVILYSPRKLP